VDNIFVDITREAGSRRKTAQKYALFGQMVLEGNPEKAQLASGSDVVLERNKLKDQLAALKEKSLRDSTRISQLTQELEESSTGRDELQVAYDDLEIAYCEAEGEILKRNEEIEKLKALLEEKEKGSAERDFIVQEQQKLVESLLSVCDDGESNKKLQKAKEDNATLESISESLKPLKKGNSYMRRAWPRKGGLGLANRPSPLPL